MIPGIYKDNDTVYHYTSSEAALSQILMHMKLRLSPRPKSYDPVENTDHFFLCGGLHEAIPEGAEQLTHELKRMLKATKQVCFCKNGFISNEFGLLYSPFERYGFAKPRMWDQYGERYRGVCLAFSREKLLEKAEKEGMRAGDVNYKAYREIEAEFQSIDIFRLKVEGYEAYRKCFSEYLIRRLFNKHLDYMLESEFRLCSFSDEYYDYMDIKDALRGVIISETAINPYLCSSFEAILDEHPDLDIQILSFKNQTLEIRSYKTYKDLITLIRSRVRELVSGSVAHEV